MNDILKYLAGRKPHCQGKLISDRTIWHVQITFMKPDNGNRKIGCNQEYRDLKELIIFCFPERFTWWEDSSCKITKVLLMQRQIRLGLINASRAEQFGFLTSDLPDLQYSGAVNICMLKVTVHPKMNINFSWKHSSNGHLRSALQIWMVWDSS